MYISFKKHTNKIHASLMLLILPFLPSMCYSQILQFVTYTTHNQVADKRSPHPPTGPFLCAPSPAPLLPSLYSSPLPPLRPCLLSVLSISISEELVSGLGSCSQRDFSGASRQTLINPDPKRLMYKPDCYQFHS